MTALLKKTFRSMREEGLKETGRKALGYTYTEWIRNVLPTDGYAVYNDVLVPPEAAERQKLGESFLPPDWTPNRPVYKGYLQCIRSHVSEEEKVVIIGGGRGVSSVVAARQTQSKDTVTVFEGSPEMIEIAKKTWRLNDIGDECVIRPEIVGPPINVYSDEENLDRISPDELPSCDFLLLDCEGAEYDILPKIDIFPSYIVVEFHPDQVPYPADKLLNELQAFNLTDAYTYYGKQISKDRLVDLLQRRKEGTPDTDGSYVKNPIGVFQPQ